MHFLYFLLPSSKEADRIVMILVVYLPVLEDRNDSGMVDNQAINHAISDMEGVAVAFQSPSQEYLDEAAREAIENLAGQPEEDSNSEAESQYGTETNYPITESRAQEPSKSYAVDKYREDAG
ncbi:hypothetical protein FKW77_000599 [Venturia effusa]|uniref:Uncharacterized protein n=1 Tax=Venturia effusa TaxID=50376 RepID=A0A517LRC7_9PEZI|nr:hypothetical protein FKW77_000599 [Venturia effusa]